MWQLLKDNLHWIIFILAVAIFIFLLIGLPIIEFKFLAKDTLINTEEEYQQRDEFGCGVGYGDPRCP